MRAQAGFTLIEMIVVLAVLGLMLGIVLDRGPPHSPTLDLRAAAGEMAQALRVARARAIATDRPVAFTVDPARNSFGVDGAPPRVLPPALRLSVLAAPGEAASARRAAIRFAPDGSSSGGRVAISEGARHAEIGVDWLTGRVSVADAK